MGVRVVGACVVGLCVVGLCVVGLCVVGVVVVGGGVPAVGAYVLGGELPVSAEEASFTIGTKPAPVLQHGSRHLLKFEFDQDVGMRYF